MSRTENDSWDLAMDAGEIQPKDLARRAAEVLCDVMNLAAALHNESVIESSDPAELRSALLRALDGMTWIGSIGGSGAFEGLTWPPDAEERLDCLRAALAAWSPLEPVPASVLEAAQRGLVILGPSIA
jgi:hypothetical protein